MRPRKIFRQALVAMLLWAGPLAGVGEPCTTFCLRDDHGAFFGKNYDWNVADGMLVVNKRGVERRSVDETSPRPARWVAKHGSVTFNQYGRDFPSGGMNEAGLVVELMWLGVTEYPAADERATVGCLEWIQYQLDTAASVPEVIASDARVRIAASTPIHYLVADRGGRAAAIEFLEGRLVAHTGKDLPVAVLANSTYADSLRNLKAEGAPVIGAPGRGATGPEADGPISLSRFARAAARVERYARSGAADPVKYAFETLRQVSQGSMTQWSIVYDIEDGRIHFRTRRSPSIKMVPLDEFDFSCSSPVLILNIDGPSMDRNLDGPGMDGTEAGDVSHRFVPYTTRANRELIETSFDGTSFLTSVSAAEIGRRARHPERAACRKAS